MHIHFKVHPAPDTTSVFTSQVFFDDALSNSVFANAPYAVKGRRSTLNRTDGIYQAELLLDMIPTADGYQTTFPIGIDRSTLGAGQAVAGPAGRGSPAAPPAGAVRPGRALRWHSSAPAWPGAYRIAAIPGDNIGPEVVAEGRRVLDRLSADGRFRLDVETFP